MTDDPTWERFRLATTQERLRLMRDSRTHPVLAQRLGPDAWERYRQLERAGGPGQHLGDGTARTLVFVPGVMGSLLVSRGRAGMWWLDVRNLSRVDDLALTPDGTDDASVGARIRPAALDLSYDAFCAAAIARPDLDHETFPYDWRRPIPAVVGGLRDLVEECHRTNGRRPVHLVAHSMGGLVVRETLRRYPQLWDRVGRIVFLGTPHYGSPAIAGYLKNHLWGFELLAVLGRYLSRSTFRSLWGVLDLLPAPAGVYPGSTAGDPTSHPCAGFDLYSADAYRLDLDPGERVRLQRVLDSVATFHTELAHWHRDLDQELRDRMLVVAGVGYKTLFRLEFQPVLGFLWEHMNKVVDREPGTLNRDGDGRVPLASAALPNVGAIRYVRAEHGKLPAVGPVQDAVFTWLSGGGPELSLTPAAALSATLSDDGHVGLSGLLPPTGTATSDDDPGYLDLAEIPDAELDRRARDVESGEVPEFEQISLL